MKGIIFQSESVRAIAADLKTQTRRLMEPQPTLEHSVRPGEPDYWMWMYTRNHGISTDWEDHARYKIRETYYIKEAWSLSANGPFYKDQSDGTVHISWNNARFMPEAMSRYKIKILDVRAERLQDITEEDALAEGCGLNLLQSIIYPLAAKAKTDIVHYIEHDETGGSEDSGDYCSKCIDKAHRKAGVKTHSICKSYNPESDSGKFCETCGILLDCTLTYDGCEEEWQHFQEHGMSLTPNEAYEVQRMLAGGDTLPDGCTAGQLAKFCYRVLWDSINGKSRRVKAKGGKGYVTVPGSPWSSNP